jgi:hypothetical protein
MHTHARPYGDPPNAASEAGAGAVAGDACPCHCPPHQNPNPSITAGNTTTTNLVQFLDPNNIVGPTGYGASGFVTPEQTLSYSIEFSNEATATAPVQVVTVTEQLDPSLDYSTFQVGDFNIGDLAFSVPTNGGFSSTRLDLTSKLGVLLDVTAGINVQTGLATWTFTSIDPQTGDVPADPLVGFLPPNSSSPAGQAFVTYTVRPKGGFNTGTQINAKATVVFVGNSPLDTRPIVNTIDASLPTSQVNPLRAVTTSTSFPVSWTGDDGAGSGIASYDVYVSTDGGLFTPYLTGTTETSTTFTGQFGHSYAFYSVATSNVGLVQQPPFPQATTYLAGLPNSSVNPCRPRRLTRASP